MTDEEYNAIYAALACDDDEGRLGLVGCTQMMASIDRLRAIEAAAREVIAVQSGQDGQIGVEYLDSYRGFICPGCAPYYEQGKARHEDGCPFKRLVEALEIIA